MKEALCDDLRDCNALHRSCRFGYTGAHLPEKIGLEHKKARLTVTNFDGLYNKPTEASCFFPQSSPISFILREKIPFVNVKPPAISASRVRNSATRIRDFQRNPFYLCLTLLFPERELGFAVKFSVSFSQKATDFLKILSNFF